MSGRTPSYTRLSRSDIAVAAAAAGAVAKADVRSVVNDIGPKPGVRFHRMVAAPGTGRSPARLRRLDGGRVVKGNGVQAGGDDSAA